MEPLFFKAENGTDPWFDWWVDYGLQWSRFFSKRKIYRAASGGFRQAGWLQWSRFFSKRKIATIFIV